MKSTLLAVALAAATADPCVTGQWKLNGVCFECPAGKYQGSASEADAGKPCLICPQDHYSHPGQASCSDDPRQGNYGSSNFDSNPINDLWGIPAKRAAAPTPQSTKSYYKAGTEHDTHHVHTIDTADTLDNSAPHTTEKGVASGGDGVLTGGNIGEMQAYTHPDAITSYPTPFPTPYPTPLARAGCMNGADPVAHGWAGYGSGGNYCNHGECIDGVIRWNYDYVNKVAGIQKVCPAHDKKTNEVECPYIKCQFKTVAGETDPRIIITHENNPNQDADETTWHDATQHACGYNKDLGPTHPDACKCFCSK